MPVFKFPPARQLVTTFGAACAMTATVAACSSGTPTASRPAASTQKAPTPSRTPAVAPSAAASSSAAPVATPSAPRFRCRAHGARVRCRHSYPGIGGRRVRILARRSGRGRAGQRVDNRLPGCRTGWRGCRCHHRGLRANRLRLADLAGGGAVFPWAEQLAGHQRRRRRQRQVRADDRPPGHRDVHHPRHVHGRQRKWTVPHTDHQARKWI